VGERARQALWSVVSFVAVLASWQAIVWLLAPPPFLLPSPGRVLTRLIAFGPDWPRHILATVQAIVLGFLVAVLFGVTGALAVVASDRFRQALTPLLVTLQIIPKIALAPLILVWFGLGIVSKITVAFLVAFFPVLINTAVGLVQIEPELLDLTRAIKARRSWVFLRVRLPNSLPYFFAGLRIASTASSSPVSNLCGTWSGFYWNVAGDHMSQSGNALTLQIGGDSTYTFKWGNRSPITGKVAFQGNRVILQDVAGSDISLARRSGDALYAMTRDSANGRATMMSLESRNQSPARSPRAALVARKPKRRGRVRSRRLEGARPGAPPRSPQLFYGRPLGDAVDSTEFRGRDDSNDPSRAVEDRLHCVSET